MPTGLQNGKFFKPAELEGEWERFKRKCDNRIVEEASAGKVIKINRPSIPTIEGFCLEIGMTSHALLNYEKAEGYEDYFTIVKRIKAEAMQFKIASLQNGVGNTTGLIFYLKAKEGWQDKQVIETTGVWKVDFGTTTDTIHPTPETGGDTSIA